MKSKDFFKDYKVVETLGLDGRKKRQLKYFGDYYVYELEHRRRTLKWIQLLLMSLIADALFIFSATIDIAPNRSGVLAAFVLILVFPLFFTTIGGVFGLFLKGKMTKNEFRESHQFMKMGAITAAVLAAANGVLRWLYAAIFNVQGELGRYWVSALCFLMTAMLCGLIYWCISKLRIRVIYGPGVDE